ncbi:MAG TPA: lytic transglycosylase domain-containing protein [Candidatus Gastranaerophilales bacterium]|nr:lytic transglycosylase domain-containing protein [Candidatus Gastranaerophilales bacterium]
MNGKKLLTCFIASFFMICLSGFFNSSLSVMGKNVYSEEAIKKRIVQEAKEQGFCPYLALSVAKQESNFDRNAVSPAGAIGLFQLMPTTAKELNVNPYHVEQNICGGIKYLKGLKNQFGSTKLAVAAYNAGPGAVQRYKGIPPYRETQQYVTYVMRFYDQYKKNPDSALVKK